MFCLSDSGRPLNRLTSLAESEVMPANSPATPLYALRATGARSLYFSMKVGDGAGRGPARVRGDGQFFHQGLNIRCDTGDIAAIGFYTRLETLA